MDNIRGTKEWAVKNFNIIKGCSHNCIYCYAHSMSIQYNQPTKDSWQEEILNKDVNSVKIPRCSGIVMYPSTHDISPKFLEEHIIFIRRLIESGNSLLLVSKPHEKCIERICKEFSGSKKNILFRFTIGSMDNSVLKFWEPNAPSFEERLECLRMAHTQGFSTSISIEPMLEGDLDALISTVSPFVTDSIWLGKINRLKLSLKMNGITSSEIINRAEQIIASQNDDAIKSLYEKHRNNFKIRYKENIKKIVGIPLSEKAGLDI